MTPAVAVAGPSDAPIPPPILQITSPITGTMLHGGTVITVTGRTDPAGPDRPWIIYLKVTDGAGRDGLGFSFPDLVCADWDTDPDPAVCTVTFRLPGPHLAGRYRITAQMQTADNHWLDSTTVEVSVFSTTRTAMYNPHTVHTTGAVFWVQGGATGNAVGYPTTAGMKVHLVYRPVGGASRTLAVRMDKNGFLVPFRAITSGTVTATTTGNALYGPSSSTLKVLVYAHFVCVLGATVRHGVIDHGRCSVAHLPAGTQVALQYEGRQGWHNLVRAPAPAGGVLRFGVRWVQPGRAAVRPVISENNAFVQTIGPVMMVDVT